MEAVGQLTGGIAHDFNNMLAVVMGSLDLLKRRVGDNPRAHRQIESAADAAGRAALLTRRLLAFSRQQALNPQPIDLNRLVGEMSELLRHSIGAGIRLHTTLADGLWHTRVDANQLENVLLNLAVNARDAMPEGGSLTIETGNVRLDRRHAAAHGVHAGDYVLVAVIDDGDGMPADVLARAFDPFFTTKEVGKGTGLGLSQVYGFVRQSGGHVRLESEPGVGTTVQIYLPRLRDEPAAGWAAGSDAASAPGGSQELILVVEDEPSVRQFSVDALEELGYRVLQADSAPAALGLLERHPDVALLFTDIVMPEVNGRRLADAVRQRRPDLPILFTTGYTRDAVIHQGVLDPDVELLGKPFTIDELARKVRAMLDAGG
jgi:CheY-like chemotaxis protein/two-component sensor histidine kinase